MGLFLMDFFDKANKSPLTFSDLIFSQLREESDDATKKSGTDA